MATPLNLWKHPEPKRLWPALGGLSVLVHIGILGLSLPYVLELMQASDSSTAAIPIELIVVSPEPDSPEPVEETPQTAFAPTKEQYSLPPRSSFPTESVQTASAANSTPVQDSGSETVVTPRQTLPEDRKVTPQPDESASNESTSDKSVSDEPIDKDNSNPLPNSQLPLPESIDNDAGSNGEGASQTNEGAGSSTETPTVPRLPEEQTLPVPGELGNSQLAPRPAALSIVGSDQAGENQQDLKDRPPNLKEGANTVPIVLDSVAQGCGPLEFSQEQWRYRVAVKADGSVSRATIYTDGIAKDISEEEKAIACLIERAGFQFEPAMHDGQPVLDDNLILTINVIEVP